MTDTTDTRPNIPAIVLLVFLGWQLVGMFTTLNQPPAPVPPDPPPVRLTELQTACNDYHDALQQHIKRTLDMLAASELETEQQTRDWLETGRKAALQAAFGPTATRDDDAFADGWTLEKQVDRLESMLQPIPDE